MIFGGVSVAIRSSQEPMETPTDYNPITIPKTPNHGQSAAARVTLRLIA